MPNSNPAFEALFQSYKAKGLGPEEATRKATEDYQKALAIRPPYPIPNSGQEYADREALIKMYTELWGFSKKDAQEEADKVVLRGPSSDIYKNRMEMAWNHLQRTDPNNKLFQTATAPFPEAGAGGPAQDPQAWLAQQALNERRAKLAQVQDPAQTAQAALNTRRENLALGVSPPLPSYAPVPIAPTPLVPAAQTPQHLEDANLSSWQSLANILGYGEHQHYKGGR